MITPTIDNETFAQISISDQFDTVAVAFREALRASRDITDDDERKAVRAALDGAINLSAVYKQYAEIKRVHAAIGN